MHLEDPQVLSDAKVLGIPSYGQNLSSAQFWLSNIAEALLQRRQSTAQMEFGRQCADSIGSNRSGQIWQELLRRNNSLPHECNRGF